MIKISEQSELDQLVEEHAASVYGVCRRVTGSPEAAWDAFQETFVTLTIRQDSLSCTDDLGPWLREVARRCSLATIRNRSRGNATPLKDDFVELSIPFSGLDESARREHQRVLREEFATLDEQDRRLLLLAYVDGVPHRDIAQRCGFPTGSTHARLGAAKSRLEAKLKKRGLVAGIALLLFLFQDSRRSFASSGSSGIAVSGGSRLTGARRTALPPLFGQTRLLVGLLLLVFASTLAAVGIGAETYNRSSEQRVSNMRVDVEASTIAGRAEVLRFQELSALLAESGDVDCGCGT